MTLLHLGSYALTVKTFFRPERAQCVDETYELHIDDEVLQVRVTAGEIHVQQGEAHAADLIIHTDISSYLGLLGGQLHPDDAISQGRIRIDGDPGALRRFLSICGLPGAQAPNQSW
jgi:putative sterol carrier protein